MSEHRNSFMNKRQFIQKLKVGGGGGGGGVMAQKQQGSIDQRDKVSFGCSLSPRFMMSKRHSFSYDSDEEVSSGSSPRINVPEGYLAVYVGRERRRFVIPTTYLRLPVFRALLEMAEEEFGFDHKGGLTLPCEVTFFKQILKLLKRNDPAQKQMSLNDILICIANERERETDALLWSKSMVPHSGASLQKTFG